MHIFNINAKAELITSKSEILFREHSTDKEMIRVKFSDIKDLELLHVEKIIYLNVNTEEKTYTIDVSSFDITILKDELKDLVFLEPTPKEQVKKPKSQLPLLFLTAIFLSWVVFYVLDQEHTKQEKEVVYIQAKIKELQTISIQEPKEAKKPIIDMNDTKILTNLGLTYWKDKKYQDALEVFQKAYIIDSNSSSNFLNYYEISIITENIVSEKDKISFKETNKDNKNILIQFDMLKILELSIKNESILPSLKQWDKNYQDVKLKWSFIELFSWLDENEFQDEDKHRIRKTIGFFIAYQQVYNLKNQDINASALK